MPILFGLPFEPMIDVREIVWGEKQSGKKLFRKDVHVGPPGLSYMNIDYIKYTIRTAGVQESGMDGSLYLNPISHTTF